MQSVFGESNRLAFLQILTAQRGLKTARLIHISNHRDNALIIAAENTEIKLGLRSAVGGFIDILDTDARYADTAGQKRFEVGKQTRPAELFIGYEFVCCDKQSPLVGR